MITYEELSKKPQVVESLVGMSLAEFDDLYAEFEIAHTKRESALVYTRRHKLRRQRAAGAGRKYKYALRDRLLMTVLWLRIYPTYEVLGRLFGVDKTTIARDIKDVYDTLAGMSKFSSEHSRADAPKLHSVHEVIDAFTDIRLVLDAKK